jgi:EAL and modified HD-GYP domain-containing signal transduction protein
MSTAVLLRLPVSAVDGEVFAHLFVVCEPRPEDLGSVTSGALLNEVVRELAEHDLTIDKTVILPGIPQLLGQHDLVGLDNVEVAFAVAYDDLAEDETLEDSITAQRERHRTVLVTGVQTTAQVEALTGFADGIILDADVVDVETAATLAPAADAARMVVLATGIRSPEQQQAYTEAGVMGTAAPTVADPEPEPALLPPRRINAEHLVRLLAQEQVAMESVDELITGDAGLALSLLELAKRPPSEGLSPDVGSVRQALLLLGRETVRQWASTLEGTQFADRSHRETSSMVLIRARFCQGLAQLLGDVSPDEAFLAGLMAGVVDLLEVDPVELFDHVASSAAVADALVHGHGPLARIVAIARAHGTSTTVAREAGLAPLEVMRAYLDAVSATGRTMRGIDDEESDTDPVVARPGQGELRRRLGTSHRR